PWRPRSRSTTGVAEPTPAEADRQLEELCRVLNYFNVGYIVFGSHVARLNGVPLETVDVDVVPAANAENLQRLVEALNLLSPRWRVEGVPGGMRIDGGLEVRHFLGDSAAIGLITRLGPIDVVLAPKGFENGYGALVGRAERMRLGDVEIRVGSLADLVRSKELLRRAKDVEHLRVLYELRPDLGGGSPEPSA
ncbi:MAG: hypothetical protein ACRD2W_17325, partial [Acidimicrobiales bacterium]